MISKTYIQHKTPLVFLCRIIHSHLCKIQFNDTITAAKTIPYYEMQDENFSKLSVRVKVELSNTVL